MSKTTFDHTLLTADVLRQNGFIYHDEYYRLSNESERYEITIPLHTPVIQIDKYLYTEDEISYVLPKPYHVDELLLALRVCGLNKLADNWRVI